MRILIAGFIFVFIGFTSYVQGATINFTGHLSYVEVDLGGAIYSGVTIGTIFTGAIDDKTFEGFITDGVMLTSFNSLIYAGGLEVFNDQELNDSEATSLNSLGYDFQVGDRIDTINIEGDRFIGSDDRRIEIGLSFLFDSSTFSNNDISNYPFNSNDLKASLFFIAEFNNSGEEIYSAVGKLYEVSVAPVPEPTTILLFASGLVGLVGFRRKRHK